MVYFDDLIWDDWNREHVARHNVRPSEVAEAVANAPRLTRARDDTYRIIGQTDAGRFLFVILAPRALDVYFPVTARDATPPERRSLRQR